MFLSAFLSLFGFPNLEIYTSIFCCNVWQLKAFRLLLVEMHVCYFLLYIYMYLLFFFFLICIHTFTNLCTVYLSSWLFVASLNFFLHLHHAQMTLLHVWVSRMWIWRVMEGSVGVMWDPSTSTCNQRNFGMKSIEPSLLLHIGWQ